MAKLLYFGNLAITVTNNCHGDQKTHVPIMRLFLSAQEIMAESLMSLKSDVNKARGEMMHGSQRRMLGSSVPLGHL